MSNKHPRLPDRAELETRLGHHFADAELLTRALRHSSAGTDDSNERLEFLGDRVLGLIVAEHLHSVFPDEREGKLAVRLNALVRREACAQVAEAAGLAPHLIMAGSEASSGGRQKLAILAGACEAVIAALYIDGGLDAAKQFIDRYWQDAFADPANELHDAKSKLQEWAQSGALPAKVQPVYTISGRSGPDHAPVFTVSVSVPGHAAEEGVGASRRDAEQDAARKMLQRLGLEA